MMEPLAGRCRRCGIGVCWAAAGATCIGGAAPAGGLVTLHPGGPGQLSAGTRTGCLQWLYVAGMKGSGSRPDRFRREARRQGQKSRDGAPRGVCVCQTHTAPAAARALVRLAALHPLGITPPGAKAAPLESGEDGGLPGADQRIRAMALALRAQLGRLAFRRLRIREAGNEKILHGGCQCGKVRYEVALELEPVIACNCSRCGRLGSLLAFAPASDFKLVSGEGETTDYQFNKGAIHHPFCATCGIESFARGKRPGDGADMVAINVRCLDGVDPGTLTVKNFDGRSL